jgi:hypothetical protein
MVSPPIRHWDSLQHHLSETSSSPTVSDNHQVLLTACLNPPAMYHPRAMLNTSNERQMEVLIGRPQLSETSSRRVANTNQRKVFVITTRTLMVTYVPLLRPRSLSPLCFVRLPLGKSYPYRPEAQRTRGYHFDVRRLPANGLEWVAICQR